MRPPELPHRPPWALRPEAAFVAACTRCGDCLPACPRGLLRCGDGGFPRIDFSSAGCDGCGACAEACLPRAIDRAQVGQAFAERIVLRAGCLADRGIECRLCGDACDARALRFVPRRGGVAALQVDPARCTGCGECLSRCPVGALALVRPAAATPS